MVPHIHPPEFSDDASGDMLLSQLARAIPDAEFWNAEHSDLRSYIAGALQVVDTLKIWERTSLSLAEQRRVVTKRDISHRLQFLVLEHVDDRYRILCVRHLTIFWSTYRYLSSRSFNLSGTCPLCDEESGCTSGEKAGTTPVRFAAELKQADAGFEIALVNIPVDQRYSQIPKSSVIPTICIRPKRSSGDKEPEKCGRSKDHKISNLQTLIDGKETRTIKCRGECNSSNIVISRWTSPEKAQERLNKTNKGFAIDVGTYKSWTKKCVITHECGQRHWVTPQQVAYTCTCISCGNDSGSAWARMVALEDYDAWLKRVSLRELDPAHQAENQAVFARRDEGWRDHEIWVRCKNHPDQVKLRNIVGAHVHRGEGCCAVAAAEQKAKYTVTYLESSVLPENLRINRGRSQICDDNDVIPGDKALYLDCSEHGALHGTFRTYQLARYGRDYKAETPCEGCDEKASNQLTPSRIRRYVDSNERFQTHGRLFRLEMRDDELWESIEKLRSGGKNVFNNLEIRVSTANPRHPERKIDLTIRYLKFLKRSSATPLIDKSASWVARFVFIFFTTWDIAFRTEESFEDLLSPSGKRLYLDFYIPELKLFIEVDGAQHVSVDHQIRMGSAEEARQKFNQIQDFDGRKDEYFSNHPEGLLLERLPAYKRIDGRVATISVSESHEVALKYCSQIYRRLKGQEPPPFDRLQIMAASHFQAVLERRKLFIERIYRGFFTLLSHQPEGDVNGKGERVIIECSSGHVISRSVAGCRIHENDIRSGRPTQAFCPGCVTQSDLDKVVQVSATAGVELLDLANLRMGYWGSLRKPLLRPLLEESQLVFRHPETNIKHTLSLREAKIPGKLAKVFTVPTLKELPEPKICAELLDIPALLAGREKAKEHNRLIKLGQESAPPDLPLVLYSNGEISPTNLFFVIESRLAVHEEFQLVTSKNQFWDESSFIGIRHKCGALSFYRASHLAIQLGIGIPPRCQARVCFEEVTGVKLGEGATTPSRQGLVPINKKDDVAAQVRALSRGYLELINNPCDVRAPFMVRVTQGPHSNRKLSISSFDNWYRRKTFIRLAEAMEKGGKLPAKLTWIEYENSG